MRFSVAVLATCAACASPLFARRAEAAPPPRALPDPSEKDSAPLVRTKADLLAPEFPPPAARLNLALAGGGIFAASYGLALYSSLSWPDAAGAKPLRIPVAGPWLSLADTGCSKHETNCSEVWVVARAVLTALDGIGQLGSLAFIGEAAFLKTGGGEHAAERDTPRLRPVPFVAETGALGLGVIGAF